MPDLVSDLVSGWGPKSRNDDAVFASIVADDVAELPRQDGSGEEVAAAGEAVEGGLVSGWDVTQLESLLPSAAGSHGAEAEAAARLHAA